jgi:protein-L-isoaspartate(D-aspartate) O-methyltransferase
MGGNGMPDRMHARRVAMVEQQLRQRGIHDQRILEVMAKVPRHEFVPPCLESHAYEDQPVPIGEGQTISQPYIVAAMLEPLSLTKADRVLEIGTGSGYQTALLAELAGEVFSIERHAPLAEAAIEVLKRLGYDNVHIRVADGSLGWPEAAPFDVIVVSAAVPQLPPSLIEQMKDGGRLIAPVGTPDAQELLLIRRTGRELTMKHLDGCRFVPLLGEQGFRAS